MNSEKKDLNNNPSHFITLNVVDWVDVFVRPLYKLVMVDALNRFVDSNGLVINAWCLMSNHLHLLATTKEGQNFPVVIRDLKKFTTKKIFEAIAAEPDLRKEWMLQRFEHYSQCFKKIEKYSLWQTCSNSHYISTNNIQMLHDHIKFIHENPVRDTLVEFPGDYIFSSARDYTGIKGLVDVSLLSLPSSPKFTRDTLAGWLMN